MKRFDLSNTLHEHNKSSNTLNIEEVSEESSDNSKDFMSSKNNLMNSLIQKFDT